MAAEVWHDFQGRFVELVKKFIRFLFIIIVQHYEYTRHTIFQFTREYKCTSLLKEASSNSKSVFVQREATKGINDLMMIVCYLYYSSV